MDITPNAVAILWPTFALVLLIYGVWLAMGVQRMAHVKRVPPRAADMADRESWGRYFRPVEAPAANFTNLFEMPVLFFALVPLLIATRAVSHPQIVLAWIYVALRLVHTLIHVNRGKVRRRFLVYVASCAVLSAMWIGFAVDAVALANAVNAAR